MDSQLFYVMSVLVTGVMSISGCGTKVQAANLMEGIAAKAGFRQGCG